MNIEASAAAADGSPAPSPGLRCSRCPSTVPPPSPGKLSVSLKLPKTQKQRSLATREARLPSGPPFSIIFPDRVPRLPDTTGTVVAQDVQSGNSKTSCFRWDVLGLISASGSPSSTCFGCTRYRLAARAPNQRSGPKGRRQPDLAPTTLQAGGGGHDSRVCGRGP